MREELGRNGGHFGGLFESESEVVSGRVWENIEDELFPKKNRKGFIFWLSCFVGAITVGSLMWFAGSQNVDNSKVHVRASNKNQTETRKEQDELGKTNLTEGSGLSKLTEDSQNDYSASNESISNYSNDVYSSSQEEPSPKPKYHEQIPKRLIERDKQLKIEELPLLVTTGVNNSLEESHIRNLHLSPLKQKSNSRFDLSYSSTIGKNIRAISGELDVNQSLSKHSSDKRVALNLLQQNFGVHYHLSDKYELRTGLGYGKATSRSRWFNRPTHLNIGENNLRFQTSEGYFSVVDTAFINSLNSGDTTDLRIKTSQSVQFISVPLMLSRSWEKNRWRTSVNLGVSADFHFNSALSFEVDENSSIRELETESEQKKVGTSLQGLLGVGVQYKLTPAISLFAEQKLSIPITSYLNSESFSARSIYANVGLGVRFNLPCRKELN